MYTYPLEVIASQVTCLTQDVRARLIQENAYQILYYIYANYY